MAKGFKAIQLVEDDGLEIMDVGNWAQKKYKLVGRYSDIFTTGMRNKWNLIYIDLFCGPGYVRNKQSGAIMKNGALIAMNLMNKFDYYTLNDYDKNYCDAIETRIKKHHPEVNYQITNFDANASIHTILNSIPKFDNGKGDLFFCFIDPFSLNLNFGTIKALASYQADFLILHALQMDGRRNFKIYMDPKNDRVANFTDNDNWRQDFENMGCQQKEFIKFVADQFDKSIAKLSYETTNKELIKNTQGNGIYYLAFYSKHNRGLDFFEKVRKGNNDQLELF